MKVDRQGIERLGIFADSIIGARVSGCGFDVYLGVDGFWAEGPDGLYDDKRSPNNEYVKSKGYALPTRRTSPRVPPASQLKVSKVGPCYLSCMRKLPRIGKRWYSDWHLFRGRYSTRKPEPIQKQSGEIAALRRIIQLSRVCNRNVVNIGSSNALPKGCFRSGLAVTMTLIGRVNSIFCITPKRIGGCNQPPNFNVRTKRFLVERLQIRDDVVDI